ncbi:DUF6883 domain-containing protein, partial [Actinokineospora sp.]|uniref:DUF6883 domain-containing protein n=1 Tax=Actinokineospora sp. TaxID=1872133 RepID=UPI003D6B8C32
LVIGFAIAAACGTSPIGVIACGAIAGAAGGAVSEGSQGRDPVQGAVVGGLFGGAFGNAAKALMAAKSVQAGATSAGTVGGNALPSSSPKAAADVRKFSDYIFKAGANHGKTPVFTRLGFSRTNSEELVEIYTSQAAEKYARGSYTLGKKDEYGQRINIEIELHGIGNARGNVSYLTSGWMVKSDGSLMLNTPFSGFSR